MFATEDGGYELQEEIRFLIADFARVAPNGVAFGMIGAMGEPRSSDALVEGRLSRRQVVAGAAVGAAGVAGSRGIAIAKPRRRRKRRRADVVIVGAGLAGLTAALDLVSAGKSVIVLEARNRVGGRVHNKHIGGGEVSEKGGTFVGPTQDRLMAMAERFNVGTFPTFATGDNVYINWAGQRSTYDDSLPTGTAPPDPLIAAEIALVVTNLNEMAATIDVEAPYDAANAEKWDSMTFESWLQDNSITQQFRDIAALAARPIFGAEPSELSLLYVLFYIAASGNEENVGTFERNFNTRDGAQMYRFKGGSQLIPKRMAKRLGRRRVIRKAPVKSIKQNRRGVTVKARGITVRAKRAIVAVPPPLASRIEYSPPLPATRDQLTQRVSQGTLLKATAVYNRPFWRDAGLNGTVVSYDGPVQVTYDASPPDGSPGVIFGFIGGDLARSFKRMSRTEQREAVLANFTKYFGAEAANPTKYFISDWPGEVWSRGGPVGFTSPGALVAYGKALRAPVRRIHWAGTETSGYWVGYMDGAVRSGERVAAEVLAAL